LSGSPHRVGRTAESSADATDLAIAPDTSAAKWVIEGLRDFDHTVGSIVPAGFDAYARVFHPARLRAGSSVKEVRWAEVAAANGRAMHPAAEWGSITGSWAYQYNDEQPGLWSDPPQTGSLPPDTARRLVEVLQRHTTTPSVCWFAVWEGKGGLRPHLDLAPRFEVPERPMWLLRGPVRAAATSPYPGPPDDSVNLWWPDDRAWCVGTDIDLMTSYIGASKDCVDALAEEPSLEVLSVSIDQYVTWDADTINPLPASRLSDES
jgi:hypothetical protein